LEEKFPRELTQGVVAEVSDYPYGDLNALSKVVRDKSTALILVLDQIQDPQNLGAILRTAEVCGVDGVLIPENRASPVTPAVCKASAGASEHLCILRVTNLVRAISSLKELGFWAVGTSVEQAQNALSFDWPEKTLLVLGSEGRGMRRLTQESCDFLIHLPQIGKISSLNVSVTAGVCLYLILKNRA
jgi:23S rRNA (guanosine2251-2'-O)-methyltransferase